MKDSISSRRFLLSCAVLIVATVLQWLGKLNPDGGSYALIVIGVVGGYITGDTMEHTSIHRTGYVAPRNNDYLDRT